MDSKFLYMQSTGLSRVLMTMYSAEYLRQSILLSAYETAETRSLFNSALKNVEGKIRTEKTWPPIEAPAGIDQVGCFD